LLSKLNIFLTLSTSPLPAKNFTALMPYLRLIEKQTVEPMTSPVKQIIKPVAGPYIAPEII